jgi:hypothetical protein
MTLSDSELLLFAIVCVAILAFALVLSGNLLKIRKIMIDLKKWRIEAVFFEKNNE